jgi:hypothetical protein
MPASPLLQRALWVLLTFVTGYSVLYACAFIQVYRVPHSYDVASRWIFDNVPAGSTLLGPHWDDRLPIGIPGFNPHQYNYECRECELPFYERDRPEVLEMLLSRMSKGDYIIFPTPRIQGSIPRIPDEYPHTTALLQLLWAEKLGYGLLTIVKETPTFFGVSFNDDGADESFSVYDHPKVTVFKNVERLSIEEMRRRVLNAEAYAPLPTLREILHTDSRSDVLVYGATSQQVVAAQALLPIGLVILLGLFISLRAPGWTSLGALSVIGIISIGLAYWTGSPVSTALLRAVALCLPLGAFLYGRRTRVKAGTTKAVWVPLGGVLVMCMAGGLGVLICGGFEVAESIRTELPDIWESLLLLRRSTAISLILEVPLGILPAVTLWLVTLPLKLVSSPVSTTVVSSVGVISAIIGGIVWSLFCVKGKRAKILGPLAVVAGLVGNPLIFLSWYQNVSGLEVVTYDGSGYERVVKRAVAWAHKSIEGAPRILEAPVDAAGKEVMVAPQAGLHRMSSKSSRRKDRVNLNVSIYELIDEAYTASDVMRTFSLLRDHNVELVVVGPREIARYGEAIVHTFERHTELFSEVFSYEGLRIFTPAFSRYYKVPERGEQFLIRSE